MTTHSKHKLSILSAGLIGCFLSMSAFAQTQNAPLPQPPAEQQPNPVTGQAFSFMQGSQPNSVYQAAPAPVVPPPSVNATQVPQQNVTQVTPPSPNAGDAGNSNQNIAGVGSSSTETVGANPMGATSAPVNYPVTPPTATPSAPPAPQLTEEQRAYKAARDSYMGITPTQIKELHQDIYQQQKAVAELPVDMPASYTGSVRVSLQPGATPPVVRPFMGLTTVILFVDAQGNPWPVENFHFVSGRDFDIRRLDGADEKDGSSFYIDAKTMISQSNVVFKLKGEPRPVVLTLLAGQPVHDANIEIRVQGKSPNAPVPVAPTFTAQSLPAGAQAALNPVLDGAPPPGGKSIKVDGNDDTRAWIMPNGHLVLRTPVVLISVARPTVVSSADGTHVYDLNRAIPTLKGTLNGSYINLSLSGY